MKKLNTDKLKALSDDAEAKHDVGRQSHDDVNSRWQSREPAPASSVQPKEQFDQLNIRGPESIIERFKALRVHARQPYYEVLEMLLDSHDRR